MVLVKYSDWKLHTGLWGCCISVAAWFPCVGPEDACGIFCSDTWLPRLSRIFGFAGENRELRKWLQFCPLSCQGRCERKVGVLIVLNLPGVIAGGEALQKSI